MSSPGQGLSLLVLLASLGASGGCQHDTIPNTQVEDNASNREVVEFVEKYRKAVETRDVATLLALASRDYFDDMGTPAGNDDVDYETLKTGLARVHQEVIDARYQISYRGLTYMPGDRVLVDLLYTGWFKVNTVNGPEWRRRLEPHRIVIAREDRDYRIVSGM